MNYLFRFIVGVLFFTSHFASSTEQYWTVPTEISSIQVVGTKDNWTLYLYTLNDWQLYGQVEDCPKPHYAIVRSKDSAAIDAILSLAAMAKATKTKVQLVGGCDYHPAYFRVDRLQLM